jgi:hypothetical protein
VFSKNRDRLLTTEMSRKVMAAILAHREVAPLLSDDHFSVDGTLVKAWASIKSFQPKAAGTPPDDDPGSPPGTASPVEDQPEPTPSETAPTASPAMPRSTSGARSGRMRPMPRPPIPTRGSTRSLPAPARCSASSAMP